ncbi:MAG: hypothetical protein SGARI_004128 [Bacillariaceae sp.]
MAAVVLEELFLLGKAQTVHAMTKTLEHLYQQQEEQEDGDTSNSTVNRNSTRKLVLDSFLRLVQAGIIHQVPEIPSVSPDEEIDGDDDDEEEFAFGGDHDAPTGPPKKKQKRSQYVDAKTDSIEDGTEEDQEAAIVASDLQNDKYAQMLPQDALWTVNIPMLHDQQRALSLGWLVFQRCGTKITTGASIVIAAQKLVAARRHAGKLRVRSTDVDSLYNFTVNDILSYIPNSILQNFEKSDDGVETSVFKTLMELSKVDKPEVIDIAEVSPGQPAKAKFRIIHDSQGELAARICTILAEKGYMESDLVR